MSERRRAWVWRKKEGTVTHALPGRNLVCVPNAGDVDGYAARPGRNVRGFGDEERARDRRTLGVVLNGDVAMDVLVVGTHAGERGKDDAVGELQVADLDRLEELGECGGDVLGHGG